MKKKLSKLISCFLVVLLLPLECIAVKAETSSDYIEDIIGYNLSKSDSDDIQEWIDGELSENAGESSEWYVIALAQYGNYNFSTYEKALLKYLDENEINSASSRLKYALSLIATGSKSEYITEALGNSAGKQGIMSLVFALHIINNQVTSNNCSPESIKEEILSAQLSDGGWTVAGQYSDVDVTAMTVQALAPYYKTDSSVKIAVDSALKLLSERQNADAGFSNYGIDNPESTAQVLTALSSLGIDAMKDKRFIKNGHTIFDALKTYQLSDGSFCHKAGESTNATATVQVFYSMVSYRLMKNGSRLLFVFDEKEAVHNEQSYSSAPVSQSETQIKSESVSDKKVTETSETAKDEKEEETSEQHSQTPEAKDDSSKSTYKVLIIATVGTLLLVSALLIIKKKKH